MIVSHYAAALVPYSRLKGQAPLWLLLLAAQIPEFLWLLLSLLRIEAPTPDSVLDATFKNLVVKMTYSHNLVPAVLQALAVFAIVAMATRKRAVALWCAMLTVVHVLCDYVVGFEHQLVGEHSLSIGLNSYGRAPHVAILFEFVFSMVLVFAFHRSEARKGRDVPAKRQLALYATFAIGVLLWLPAASMPMRSLFAR